MLCQYYEHILKNHFRFILFFVFKLKPCDHGKNYGLEKNHINIKYKI